jgi:2-succinyl-5-enolpyruvyl-6-hydroxy-3-cyclohexene-1-carboxylate synthase
MNIRLACEIVTSLHRLGVREYVVCAGGRNAPLVKVLCAAAGLRIHHFFDERAAAFFALGRSRQQRRPVAVATTSGTATAELLPAAIEAHYAGVPLVLITADRPRSYRGSGAPQAIEQVQLFGPYADLGFDIERVDEVDALRVSSSAPTHINVCFDEPLIDGEVPALQLEPIDFSSAVHASDGAAHDRAKVERFPSSIERPLVIVGGLRADRKTLVLDTLRRWGAAVYAEAPSGLREAAALAALRISGAGVLTPASFRRHFDAVIRIGDVPTVRLWRDLEDALKEVPVLSIGDSRYSGLARDKSTPCGYAVCEHEPNGRVFALDPELQRCDRVYRERLSDLLARFPDSEPGLFRRLSSVVPAGSLVMLGNSLPIREWDLAASHDDRHLTIVANRGANGIDGLVSTFLGLARSDVENWLILGDLSALYDLNALAFTPAVAPGAVLRVVVINNRGGRVFEPMFRDEAFVNEHGLEFSSWARMFGWSYRAWDGGATDTQELQGVLANLPRSPTIVELRPDESASAAFSSAHGALMP